MTTNGTASWVAHGAGHGSVTQSLPLTAGMQRDLERIREFEREHGELPTPCEYAALYGMRMSSADGAFVRLAAAGLLGPRRPYQYYERSSWSPAEAELRRVTEFLREADAILSAIAVMDRPKRDQWRAKVAVYLSQNSGAAGGPAGA
jgi:hypothetical protein